MPRWRPAQRRLTDPASIRYDPIVTRSNSLSTADLAALAEFRYRIRRFLHFSEEIARQAGLEPQQHQLLLFAAAGAAPDRPASIGELAERLQLMPHSVDELVVRAEANGLVRRRRGLADRRIVLVEPTDRGRRILDQLAEAHRTELRTIAAGLVEALRAITETPTAAG